MSVQRAQFEITSTEFLDWIVYLDADVNAFHREDYFLANIVAEIRRGNVKKGVITRVEDFLIKFKFKKKEKQLSKKEQIKRMNKRKSWMGHIVGLK